MAELNLCNWSISQCDECAREAGGIQSYYQGGFDTINGGDINAEYNSIVLWRINGASNSGIIFLIGKSARAQALLQNGRKKYFQFLKSKKDLNFFERKFYDFFEKTNGKYEIIRHPFLNN